MKKTLLFFLIFITTITGCKNKKIEIISTIKQDDYFLSVQYPVFQIDKLDKKISNDIKSIETNFYKEKKQCDELNIDFEYKTINRKYISVIITAKVYSKTEKTNIFTYFFDIENNKFITIDKLIDNKKEINKLVKQEFYNKYKKSIPSIFTLDNFYISKNYVNFYITKNKFYLIQIPLDKINFKIDITFNNIKTPLLPDKKEKTVDINKPVVALTFDDGPSKYTNEIVDILKENDACGTFFVLGNKVSYYQETLLKLIENGNEIGNHTYNHKLLSNLNELEIKSQIDKSQQIIKEYIAYTPTIFRRSYGDIPKNIKENIPLEVILWNIDTLDWKLKNKNKIIKRATKNIKDGDIILMHDTYKRSKDSLPEIIKILKEKGFQFVTISELIEIKKIRDYNE